MQMLKCSTSRNLIGAKIKQVTVPKVLSHCCYHWSVTSRNLENKRVVLLISVRTIWWLVTHCQSFLPWLPDRIFHNVKQKYVILHCHIASIQLKFGIVSEGLFLGTAYRKLLHVVSISSCDRGTIAWCWWHFSKLYSVYWIWNLHVITCIIFICRNQKMTNKGYIHFNLTVVLSSVFCLIHKKQLKFCLVVMMELYDVETSRRDSLTR